MKASYHVYLPKLSVKSIHKISAKHNLIVSKAVCQAPASDENMWHIYNPKMLGRSETLILKDLYDGVKALVQAEIAMTPAKWIIDL